MNVYRNKVLNTLSEVESVQAEGSSKQVDLLAEDASLQAALLYVEECTKILVQLENDVCDEIERTEREIDSPNFLNKNASTRGVSSFSFGRPFFKDRQHFSPYPNEDVITKKKYNEINLTDVPLTRRWQRIEKRKLMNAIRKILIDKRSADCKAMLYAKPREEYSELELEALDTEMQKRLSKLHSLAITELVYDKRDEYDWMKISATDLHGIHSPEECRALWHLYYSPAINKSAFTPEENDKLKELVYEYCYQNWDEIAERLGTGRSGYQCLIQYQLKLNKVIKKSQWTKEENYKLLKIVKELRVGQYIPWGQVTKRMEGRTKVQVFNHYKYSLAPFIKKGRFSEAESQMILAAIHKYGNDYKQLARFLPGRTPVQIRDHYKSHLQRLKMRKPWNNENDPLLLDLVEKWGTKKWHSIAKFFPDFTRAQLRHRYLAILKYKRKHPDREIVPVRHHKSGKKNVQEKVHDLIQKCQVPENLHDTVAPINEGDLVDIQEQLGLQQEGKKPENRGRRPGHKKPLVLLDRKMLSFFDIIYRLPPLPPQLQKQYYAECPVKNYQEEADKIKEMLSFFKLWLKIPAEDKFVKEKLTMEDNEEDLQILKILRENVGKKTKPVYGKSAALEQSQNNSTAVNKGNTSQEKNLGEGNSLLSNDDTASLDVQSDANVVQRTGDEHVGRAMISADLNVSFDRREENNTSASMPSMTDTMNKEQSTENYDSSNKKRKFVTSSLLHNSKCTYTFAEYVKEYLKNRSQNSNNNLQSSNTNTACIDLTQSTSAVSSIDKPNSVTQKQPNIKTYAYPRKTIIFPVQNNFLSCDTVPPIKQEPVTNHCAVIRTVKNSHGDKQNVVCLLNDSSLNTGVCPVQKILAKSGDSNALMPRQALNRENDSGMITSLNYTRYLFPPCITTLIGCRTLLMSLRNVAKQFNSELRRENQVVSKLRLADLAAQSGTEDSDPDTTQELILLRAASNIWFSRLTSLFYYPLITTNLRYSEGDTCFGSGCRGGTVASRSQQVLELEREFNLKEYQTEVERSHTEEEEDSNALGHKKKKFKKIIVEKRRANSGAESGAEITANQPKRKYTKRNFGDRSPSGRTRKPVNKDEETATIMKDNIVKENIKKPKVKRKDNAEDGNINVKRCEDRAKESNEKPSSSKICKEVKSVKKQTKISATKKTNTQKGLKKLEDTATNSDGEGQSLTNVESQVDNVASPNKEIGSPEVLKKQVEKTATIKTNKSKGKRKPMDAATVSNLGMETSESEVENTVSPKKGIKSPKTLKKQEEKTATIKTKKPKVQKKLPHIATSLNGETETNDLEIEVENTANLITETETSKVFRKQVEKTANIKTKNSVKLVDITAILNGEMEDEINLESQVQNAASPNEQKETPKSLKKHANEGNENKQTKKSRGRPRKQKPNRLNGDLNETDALNDTVETASSPEIETPTPLKEQVVNTATDKERTKKSRGRPKKEIANRINGNAETPCTTEKRVKNDTSPTSEPEEPVVSKKIKIEPEFFQTVVERRKKTGAEMLYAEGVTAKMQDDIEDTKTKKKVKPMKNKINNEPPKKKHKKRPGRPPKYLF